MAYQGGKQKLGQRIYEVIDRIEEFFTGDELLDYLEPFVGFCGVMKHFGELDDRKLTGCDANKDVIAMWKAVQKGWKPPIKCSKKKYEELKHSSKTSAERGFIGVACSYSGIFYVGYRGQFNYKRKYGEKIVSAASIGAKNVNSTSKMIKNVKFKICDYQKLKPTNTLIYCDPPYVTNKYQQSEFFHFNSSEFWEIMRDWSKPSKGNIVIISEYKAPKDFKAVWKSSQKVVHNGSTDNKVEKLFMYGNLYKELDAKTKKNVKNI